MTSYSSIHDLLARQAEADPEAIAIDAPGRVPLSYRDLWSHTQDIMAALAAVGVQRHDRVALVLANGPELAVAFLAVAAYATCAPLNSTSQAKEFDSAFTALRVKVLMVSSGMDSPARDVARAHGVQVVEVAPSETSCFALSTRVETPAPYHRPAEAQDVALVLQTSGTTSRPKTVPLTHGHLCTSARNIRATLALGREDRCLNIMSLHHIHGLVAATLASLTAGGRVICTPGLQPGKFFDWLSGYQPTWYTAVPTMHQAVLEQAAAHPGTASRTSLRLIRSSSAPLPPPVMAELERVFEVPVIESYGMTESSHQIASNPLPPQERKPGSVGVAAGPEVAILDNDGKIMPPGSSGEVAVRGATIMQGYENPSPTTPDPFTQGWFRTGDQGHLDQDGYLFLTGRLKEMINRGGHNISPREIDDDLMNHPAVAQVVTFAVPHPTLGEDVAAAVVLRRGQSATEEDIREFALERLTGYKVPSRVVLVDRIPTGSTGKLQRLGLAETLADQLQTEYSPPRNDAESAVVDIWCDVLGLKRVGIRDNFFALGGDSLLAAAMLARVKDRCGKTLPPLALLQAPTVIQFASLLGRSDSDDSVPWRSLVPLQPHGTKPPFFCMHGQGGGVVNQRQLSSHLGLDQPYYALQAQGLDESQPPHRRIEDMAAHYITEIHTVQPEGPYFIGGFCFGGVIAFEVAQQLVSQGQEVALLLLAETPMRRHSDTTTGKPRYRDRIARLGGVVRYHARQMSPLTQREKLRHMRQWGRGVNRKLRSNLFHYAERWGQRLGRTPTPLLDRRDLALINHQARKRYVPRPYAGRVTLFLSTNSPEASPYDSRRDWADLAAGGAEVYELTGDHHMLHEPYAQVVSKQLEQCLSKTRQAP